MPKTEYTYEKSGVNIDSGNKLIKKIKKLNIKDKNILSSIGGFGSLYSLPSGYKNPILVSGTDGVGTKLNLGTDFNMLDNIGIDLVAMCVNDILCHGAKPLFFLDYFATSNLIQDNAFKVIKSIHEGCNIAKCSLVGGETAEMPGMYKKNDFDIAGFSVGIVEKKDLITGANIKQGNLIIGLQSSGIHSNGFSLIRKLIADKVLDPKKKIGSKPLISLLMTPTKIYVETILKLLKKIKINGIVHITGGGIVENVPRVLPKTCKAIIETESWLKPKVYHEIFKDNLIAIDERFKVFNCGIGMAIIINKKDLKIAMSFLKNNNEKCFLIGEIRKKNKNDKAIELK